MSESPIVRGFLILAIVALAGALAFFLYNLASLPNRQQTSTAAPRATEVWRGEQSQTVFTDAEAKARARVQAWAPDAVLVQAEGSWRIGESWTEVDTPPVAWFFSYYSKEARKIATVGVSDEGLNWTTPRAVQAAPQPITTFPPAQGPETAWLSFRAYDGERFLGQHTGALVKLRLTQGEETAIWSVSALKPPHQLNVEVNASTGSLHNKQN